jgi:hypothetical protein
MYNVIAIGMSLIFIGLIIYFSPRILKEHLALCDATRQAKKNEAQALGQTDRHARF